MEGTEIMERKNKRLYLILAVVIVVAAGSYSYWKRLTAGTESHHSAGSFSDDQIESLRALPYAQWSDQKATSTNSGVTQYDPHSAYPGYNLFTNDKNEIYLVDMSGKHKHTWKVPNGHHCEYAVLLNDGHVLTACESQFIMKLDWDSNPVWQTKLHVHHEIEVLPDRSILTLVGDKPVPYKSRNVVFDSIVHLSESGGWLDKWSTFDNLETLKRFHLISPLDTPPAKPKELRASYSYYHLNAIRLLPDTPLGQRDRRFQSGNLLICSRNTSMIAILDKATRKPVWSFGPTILENPHFPVMLETGNLLIFDNGFTRKSSRVLEIEPSTGKTVWEYTATPPSSFFSPWQGSVQRLPNGNTLICESNHGHVFEVRPDKRIVWEFWNPVINEKGKRKTIYRFLRLPVGMVEALLTKP